LKPLLLGDAQRGVRRDRDAHTPLLPLSAALIRSNSDSSRNEKGRARDGRARVTPDVRSGLPRVLPDPSRSATDRTRRFPQLARAHSGRRPFGFPSR
jgi:hypothetical protein